jgi:hypothetical protein
MGHEEPLLLTLRNSFSAFFINDQELTLNPSTRIPFIRVIRVIRGYSDFPHLSKLA